MIGKILKKIMFPGNRLTQRAVSSSIWLGISRISNRVLSFIRTVILARLLSPQDFGLFGIALIILSALQTFSQPGTGEALIQKKNDIRAYLDIAWTIKIIRGFLLAIILFVLSPFFANFFHEPKAIALFHIIGWSLIIGGLGNQGVIYFVKDLEFHKQFVYEIIPTCVDFIVSIILVFTLRNAFALAYGYLSGIIVLSAASYFLHPYRPKFVFDLKKIRELARFGRWVWGYTVMSFLLTQGIGFFIGKVLGATVLGLYQMAMKLTSVVTTELSSVFGSIGFSLYSKLQDNTTKLREGYSKLLKINCFIITPSTFFLFANSKQLTAVVLGEKWLSLPGLINLLSFYGLIASISAINNTVFKSIGRPDITSKIQFVKLFFISSSIFLISSNWGIYGITALILSVELMGLPFEFILLAKRLNIGLLFYTKILIMPVLSSFLMLVGLKLLSSIFFMANAGIVFLTGTFIICILQYFAFTMLLDKVFNYGINRLFDRQFINKLLDIQPGY